MNKLILLIILIISSPHHSHAYVDPEEPAQEEVSQCSLIPITFYNCYCEYIENVDSNNSASYSFKLVGSYYLGSKLINKALREGLLVPPEDQKCVQALEEMKIVGLCPKE